MPAYNFQPRFAGLVESGQKIQTIRKTCRARPGQMAYLYTGQRTKLCRKLGEGVITGVCPVNLLYIDAKPYFLIDSLPLVLGNIDEFAQADGFRDAAEMCEWFDAVHGLPFSGWLIRWKPLHPRNPSEESEPYKQRNPALLSEP